MKDSLYNTILHVSEKHTLIYNALSDKYLVLPASTEGLAYGRLAFVGKQEIYDRLEEIGAIVDDKIDEVRELRNLIRRHDYDEKTFQLHVNPTLDCNCRCWYCYEEHAKGSHMSAGTLAAVINFIRQTVEDNNTLEHFALSFFGGEPLMCFANVVVPLVEELELICQEKEIMPSVHFTTNGALINDEMLEFFSDYKASFQITLDGHRFLHDKVRFSASGEGTYDKILANIRALAERRNSVLIRINYTRDNIMSIPDILKDLSCMPADIRSLISVNFQRVWQDFSNDKEDEITMLITEYMRDFAKLDFGVSSHYVHDMVRNSCYGDKRNYLLVNFNGAVYRCTARDFNEQNRAGTLMDDGTVQWKDNALECRLAAKFSKPVCHTCRIAPLCAGGCCQQAIQHTNPNECTFKYTDDAMDTIVANRFEQMFLIKPIEKSYSMSLL